MKEYERLTTEATIIMNKKHFKLKNFSSLKLLEMRKIIVWKIIHFHKHCALKIARKYEMMTKGVRWKEIIKITCSLATIFLFFFFSPLKELN